jgi:hypothetical protein
LGLTDNSKITSYAPLIDSLKQLQTIQMIVDSAAPKVIRKYQMANR